MPLSRQDFLVLFVLIASVPLQHVMVKYSSSIRKGFIQLDYIWNNVYTLTYAKITKFSTVLALLLKNGFRQAIQGDLGGECPAVEVMKHVSPDGAFTFSPVSRSYRPTSVLFRVGQVVRDKKKSYKGVIIGWDRECQAPDSWIRKNYKTNLEICKQPHYLLFIGNEAVESTYQLKYIPQDRIEPITEQIPHDKLRNYFDDFDGAQYILQPWLRELYPRD